eukprot:TRINITY_DN27145_c0_g1_i1.p1 TRINITY_DN27145_c0_g1~~TRINITY_DN27145_c0_g1_i1.p1  ORF type:complete len:242 (-),score=26.41 TRINITY_DN27145_c0_g1_i1:366-1049(-)
MTQSAKAVADSFRVDGSSTPWQGALLSYDEMRLMHNDDQETSRFASAGELLAWHVRNASNTARKAFGTKVRLYVWDDMFNPYHNAGTRGTPEDGYFLINGSMRGSWEGLDPKTISMMTWGPCDEDAPAAPGLPPCKFRSGLQFFAGRGLTQIVGGFYDYALCPTCPKNGTAAAEREFRFTRGIPNIEGFSYTTWGSNNEGGKPNYAPMCDYARTLRKLYQRDESIIV